MVTVAQTIMTIRPEGELTIYRAEELHRQILAAFDTVNRVEVDVSRTEKIDTSAFQLLAVLQRSCTATEKTFTFSGLHESTLNFLELYGCRELFSPEGVTA